MGMKFRNDSDEETCGKGVPSGQWYGDLACMRVAGHDGECIPVVGPAAKADGLQHCCRIPLGSTEHREGCYDNGSHVHAKESIE
jgi:hypothetical protein